MSNNPASAASVGLLKGCLGGIALAIVFLTISGAAYVITSAFDVPQSLSLLISIGSGPIIGTLLLILYALRMTAKTKQNPASTPSPDETATGDSA